ncbi:SAC3/GANP family [Fragilaria crotonensis]|nr:SAC3/GANP family [Fragilaria crotonensis]
MGRPLINDERDVARRIIGNKSPAQGTAEPEMRAIYILLTLENDGGMEVLKYAAKLSSERPEVFNSKPVQLALEIFKAKHELNYARFFSILRARTTPYLFACLMFKHVEEMRRTAFRVMYTTYGYKKKDTPAIQDQYPLFTLVRLLCFEDIDEARSACKHYNITTKEVDLASNSSPTGKKRLELIFWKASRFTIPKDEVKGVVIPLRPRKMLRTIESKLNGVTRLAVCRGESGSRCSRTEAPQGRSRSEAHEEEVRRQAEDLAREQERQIALRKELEEKERQKQKIEKENARKRQEDERARLRLLQQHVEKQYEEERRKADEEARRRAEREAEVNHAKKLLLWKRIRHNLDPLVQRKKTEQSLRRIDPTFSMVSSATFVQKSQTDYRLHDIIEHFDDPDELPLGDFLEELIQLNTVGSLLTGVLYKAVGALEDMIPATPAICSSSVHTLTLACIVPKFEGVQAETAYELLHKWMDSRFSYDVEQIYTSGFSEIRFIALNGNKLTQWDQIDFALLVIPPYMNDVDFTNTALTSILPRDRGRIPIVALTLEDGSADEVYKSFLQDALTSCGVERIVETQGDETKDFEAALGAAFREILRLFVEDNERMRQEDVARHNELAEQHRLEGQRLVAEANRRNAEAEERAKNLLQKQLDLEDARNKADDQERRWRLEVEHNKATKTARQKERMVNRSPTPTLDDEFQCGRKRSFEVKNDTPFKRGREETDRERESKAFTARLEAILKGDLIIDTKVGNSTLRELLANVPPIREIPGDIHLK